VNVFIFGAGASLGSQGNVLAIEESKRAPLVNQIFDNCYRNFAIRLLTPDEFADCRAASKNFESVEHWLTARWERIDALPHDRNRRSERAFFGRVTYYLWDLFQHVSDTYDHTNGYSVFMKNLADAREDFGLISFNYDTLLDRAVEDRFKRIISKNRGML
jgi:hypothetical protein